MSLQASVLSWPSCSITLISNGHCLSITLRTLSAEKSYALAFPTWVSGLATEFLPNDPACPHTLVWPTYRA